MLEVTDEKGAREYESSIGAGAPEPEDYKGTELREDDRGLATAIVGDFLVIGSADGVRSVIDVSEGGRVPTRSEDATDRAGVRRAAGRQLRSGVSVGRGDRQLPRALRRRLRVLRAAGRLRRLARCRLLASARMRAATGSRREASWTRSETPRRVASSRRSCRSSRRSRQELAPDTLAYVGFGDADETVGALLAQATVRAPGIASGVTDLVDRLRKDAGVDLTDELLPALTGEGAVAIAPRPAASGRARRKRPRTRVPDDLQVPGRARDDPRRPVRRPLPGVHRRRGGRGSRGRRARAAPERACEVG